MKNSIDLGLLIPVLILITLSLLTLFTIDIALFRNQLIFFVIGILACFIFAKVNINILKHYSTYIYFFSILSLVLVLTIGIESRGSLRWFEILGFRFQFSEILKPFLIISFSTILQKENYSFRKFMIILLLLSPLSFLIFKQPDLGNALIYASVVFFTLIIYGLPKRYFLVIIALFAASIPFLWKFLHDYQKERVLTYLHPTDVLGVSYNVIQSIITVGSGMFLGRGLGLGTQSGLRFLPELHTDFIFATISEQLGFIGSGIIVLTFFALLFRIIFIIKSQEELFSKMFATGAFFLIFIQFFVNTGMNIGIVPIVGITLPFVSYGGSSLVSNFILIGLLSAIVKKQKSEKALEIR